MEDIYKWALSVIACTVIASITELLINDKKFEKTIKAVIGGVLLCTILFPVIDLINNIKEPEFDNTFTYESKNNDIEEMEKRIIDEKLSKTAENVLIQNNIDYLEINVKLSYDENGKAENIVCYISIPGTKKNNIPEIKKLINEKLGTDPKIICISSNE